MRNWTDPVGCPQKSNWNRIMKMSPSGRGKLIVEVVRQSGGWALQAVFRQALFPGSPGSETRFPEDDRPTIRLLDNDAAFARVKEAFQKAQAGS